MAISKNTGAANISKIKSNRKILPSAAQLIQGILKGDRSSLARAITLVESTNTRHLAISNEIIEACLPHSGKSIRLGITGVPGVGKSTFIEALGTLLTSLGKKVAVLAVDPSSTVSKGSILGDKTRMPELVKNRNAFIRPSPSSSSLGGVARKTRESIILCEAAGYDTILIETVGVGQSETAVHSMVDFFLLLKLAGAGDELQGIKRGIMEMADAIVINKADGENLKQVNLAKIAFTRALHLYPPKENNWTPPVLSCSSITQKGIVEIWEMIRGYIANNQNSDYFNTHRKLQNKYWLLQTIDEHLQRQFYQNSKIKSTLDQMTQEVINGRISPFSAAEKLIQLSKEK